MTVLAEERFVERERVDEVVDDEHVARCRSRGSRTLEATMTAPCSRRTTLTRVAWQRRLASATARGQDRA